MTPRVPWRTILALGFYDDQILPRCLHWAMGRRAFAKHRSRCLHGLSGRVLEVGFGSGHNLAHFPDGVTEVLALEPSELARKLARSRVEAAPMPVSHVDLDGARIPLDANSVDGIACSWTLCTIPDVDRALAEMVRVLKPEGALHFIEHGRSEQPGVARWQDRLNPIQKAVAGGCHLNRPIDQLVQGHFEMETLDRFHMRGPRILTTTYMGVARPRK